MKKFIASAIVIAIFASLIPLSGVSASYYAIQTQTSSGAGAVFETMEYIYSLSGHNDILISGRIREASWYTFSAIAKVDCNVYLEGQSSSYPTEVLFVRGEAWFGLEDDPDYDSYTSAQPIGCKFRVEHVGITIYGALHFQSWTGYAAAGNREATITSSRNFLEEFLVQLGFDVLQALIPW